MPFMKGRAPIRRTLQYLKNGALVFKKNVQVMIINYNTGHAASKGAYNFQFWHIPQIQYKNPKLQILTMKNMTPTPFIQFILDSGEKVVMDVYNKEQEEIHEHIRKIFCKTQNPLSTDATTKESNVHPANFGHGCSRWCICEVPGQVPCSGFVTTRPEVMGKNTWQVLKQKEKEEM
ncbi:probable 28S ribosomal protein S25, mitochondrial isoform X1 [Octopus sinensis]|uniref:Small ribosomal subunit protein mS25 n=1 Tax=Octopus sinensis TaxID=2607531 RepID=A0A6P7S552_9MOLL|nr:probable 28S ribosomal protein S25, mitochondrial isoform X1 [Octopus sinensis]